MTDKDRLDQAFTDLRAALAYCIAKANEPRPLPRPWAATWVFVSTAFLCWLTVIVPLLVR